MKKIYIHMMMLAALVVAGAAMTSCQKEEAVTGKFSMTVKATKGGGNTKALSLEGHTLSATWAAGERVTVHNDTKNADLGGYLEAQSDGSETTLYGTLTGTIENNDVLTLKFRSDNYNNQDGTLEYIAANCDYATATVQVTVDGDGKVHTGNADFQNHQAIVKFTLKNRDGTDWIENPTAFTVNDGTRDGVTILSSIPFTTFMNPNNGTAVLYVALPAVSDKPVTITASLGHDTFTYATSSNITFENGRYYEVTVGMKYCGTLTQAPSDQYNFLQYSLAGGHVPYNNFMTAAEAYAVAIHQTAINGNNQPVYLIMSVQNDSFDSYEIHYAYSNDATPEEHTTYDINVFMDQAGQSMYYLAL